MQHEQKFALHNIMQNFEKAKCFMHCSLLQVKVTLKKNSVLDKLQRIIEIKLNGPTAFISQIFFDIKDPSKVTKSRHLEIFQDIFLKLIDLQ